MHRKEMGLRMVIIVVFPEGGVIGRAFVQLVGKDDVAGPGQRAGDTLRSLVGLVADMSEAPQGLELGEVAGERSGSPDLDLPIEDLDLSERPRNCLKRAQVNSIGELLQKTEDDLLAITNFGQKSLDEVIQKLDERGLQLRTKD